VIIGEGLGGVSGGSGDGTGSTQSPSGTVPGLYSIPRKQMRPKVISIGSQARITDISSFYQVDKIEASTASNCAHTWKY
jgi:hypothetical protein